MKRIVVCCDGTGNEFGDANSNVIKLFRALDRSTGSAQIAYYHPGVGTMGAKSALSVLGKVWTKVRGLAFGYGLSENIADAYRYLMQNYEPGDEVYIFGFSRGAYTARALCGVLQMFGLMSPDNEGMIPYALRLFKQGNPGWWARWRCKPTKFTIAQKFKATFSIECKPEFLGVFDTVSSVGWILDPFRSSGSLPYTAKLLEVAHVRHAVSLDERRAFFRQNLVNTAHPDLKQIWFAGVHSDVGGSYPEAESGLSKITLSWMLKEASGNGLKFDMKVVGGELGAFHNFAPPSACAMKHNSLTWAWVLGEFWPKMVRKCLSAPDALPQHWVSYPRINLFRRRTVPEGSVIHQSVFTRQANVPGYVPKNLPTAYTVQPDQETPAYPRRLAVGESFSLSIFASLKWNDTTVSMEAGESYRLTATGWWVDAGTRSGPDGYPCTRWGPRLLQWLKRSRRDPYSRLMGALGKRHEEQFAIGASLDKTVTLAGVLWCFANDVPHFYFNNSGQVVLTMTRTV